MIDNIFLVRHGQSLANVDKAVHSRMADHAIPLSEKGEKLLSMLFQRENQRS